MAEIAHLKKAAEALAATHMDIRTREPADDIGWFACEMVAALAELETLRGERDALRAALEAVREYAKTSQGEWLGVSQEHAPATAWDFKEIVEMADTALNTQPAPQAEWTPRRMQIKHGYNMWFYRQNNQPAITFKEGDIVNAGETDHNGTHVRNLEDNAGALIPTKFLAPVDKD